MKKRKALSRKIRFEVFKRDRFACIYCGKKAPEALLEVDHILALSNGGTDEITNLVSACDDCNRGKAARLLEEGSAPVVTKAATDSVRERVEQARAYAEAVKSERELLESTICMVWDAWAAGFRAERTKDGWKVTRRTLRPLDGSEGARELLRQAVVD